MIFPSSGKYKIFGSKSPIPLFLTFAICLVLYLYFNMTSSPQSPIPAAPPQNYHYEYTVVKGLFQQSEQETDDSTFDFRKENFGLINRSYPTDIAGKEEEQWRRFERYIASLNETTSDGESIKVLFLARHGQGWHNVAETKYGTKAWDCHYAALNGSTADNLTWSDAHLTPLGTQQALSVNELWSHQLPLGLPPPQTYYVSPLTRTIQTADLTFTRLPLPKNAPYKPLIKELLREALGVHTCDRRSSASSLRTAHPHLTFESNFSEQDVLWEKDYREPRDARRYRLSVFLDDVWESDKGVWISMTSHSGAIASLLEGVGHRAWGLETGGVVPVVVKGRRIGSGREVPVRGPSDGPDCKEGDAGGIE
ncbi:phosphoglycerate mutase-like protein [Plenodomus tracheiphilus IPT5]|uniref:Phosphoglycerate mutase-like protein n=1 Tax=Plenodomus tracheiphilus IPT5 TaxID=1408161 RepID=A0A6A7AZ79_9PLEO|nr:phosphoglycerate mutase-like protein [Plenodomus tracheiphilus IPT5]